MSGLAPDVDMMIRSLLMNSTWPLRSTHAQCLWSLPTLRMPHCVPCETAHRRDESSTSGKYNECSRGTSGRKGNEASDKCEPSEQCQTKGRTPCNMTITPMVVFAQRAPPTSSASGRTDKADPAVNAMRAGLNAVPDKAGKYKSRNRPPLPHAAATHCAAKVSSCVTSRVEHCSRYPAGDAQFSCAQLHQACRCMFGPASPNLPLLLATRSLRSTRASLTPAFLPRWMRAPTGSIEKSRSSPTNPWPYGRLARPSDFRTLHHTLRPNDGMPESTNEHDRRGVRNVQLIHVAHLATGALRNRGTEG